ncbi:MAG: cell division protein FtsZ [Desulfobulbaceae bacterium]|uniref:Cell division protein FtsZ n=1 Tax=Candidatus Desulfobia pelagia TaxID=2841692 RepID=A0A8J6TCY9_9BACT|nr:cell division protein FtsZ [Candidatus Desulfobia pelagia]
MEFTLAENSSRARIKVIGVGGGGGNAINTMVESKLLGVEFIAANTDLQALEHSRADLKLQIGAEISKGLGAGANPERGRESAEESIAEIRESLKESDMVFVTAGLGGGTGTGAAPVVARISKELGALTVAVVTKPFVFEGRARMKNAEAGWEQLKKHVDTIITIPNDRILSLTQRHTTFVDGMKMADDVLVQAVKGITDLINLPGYINPDFADVRTVMNEMGPALMGAGVGVGEKRASEAVRMAIASPLLQDISIDGARGVLVNISAKKDTLTMAEVTEATSKIYEEVHDDANIILGVIFDDSLGEELRVTVIATGIKQEEEMEQLPEKVTQLVTRAEKEPAQNSLPFGESGLDHDSGNPPLPGSKRKRYAFNVLDEELLDEPTFIRRNEN